MFFILGDHNSIRMQAMRSSILPSSPLYYFLLTALFKVTQVIGQKYYQKKKQKPTQNETKPHGNKHIGSIVSRFGPFQYKKDVDKIV